MRNAYPAIKCYRQEYLDVGKGHRLYIEESGNSEGIPVLFVHGGPGAGTSVQDRCFFNPEQYRIILFDQRGCGHSTPHAMLENNTTTDLLADMEKIREFLKVEKWLLFGGSWGSTLSLLYAQAHPKRVLALILRGIFLCRQRDLDWFYREGASRVFPDNWRMFSEFIPQDERDDLVAAYHRRVIGGNELVRMGAAKHWAVWEANCASLNPNSDLMTRFANPHTALSLTSIETHYFLNKAFIRHNHVLDNCHRLKGISGIIVHGRYDVVCPVDQAYALHEAWPDARLDVIRDAGHASSDAGILDALVKATDDFAQQYSEVS